MAKSFGGRFWCKNYQLSMNGHWLRLDHHYKYSTHCLPTMLCRQLLLHARHTACCLAYYEAKKLEITNREFEQAWTSGSSYDRQQTAATGGKMTRLKGVVKKTKMWQTLLYSCDESIHTHSSSKEIHVNCGRVQCQWALYWITAGLTIRWCKRSVSVDNDVIYGGTCK